METRGRRDGSDRISELPEPVLHHILCFLSQKRAVKTCVLSKSWRQLGTTRPVIDFREACDPIHATSCEDCFGGNNETFLSTLETTFQRYRDLNLSAQKLTLDILDLDSSSISLLQKWIPIFFNPNSCVTEFRLSFSDQTPQDNWSGLELPSAVFRAESLESLYLHRCKIHCIDNSVVFKNLQKLSLINVCIDDETLKRIISSCRFIEYAELRYCKGLKTIVIGNDKEYPPLLEEFKLYSCLGFEEINLCCPKLKKLTILLESSIKVYIDAPKILHFKFPAKFFPTTVTLMTTSREWKTDISLSNEHFDYDHDDVLLRFRGLNEMLKAVSGSQIFLDISERMLTEIEAGVEFGIHDPVVVEVLSIGDIDLSMIDNPIGCLFNALFQICRPRYITTWYSSWRPTDNETAEVGDHIFVILINAGESDGYPWHGYLEDVAIEVCDSDREVWKHVNWTCLPEESTDGYKRIRFGMKWRE